METESQPIRHVTLELIRKRSEHNERLVSNLEEIALHQEDLQAIGPVLPRACGSSLRILLLQNNVISRLDPKEMKFFKQLEYLNLALNNIQVVKGIGHLEFLNKLDLTLNFICIDRLEESIDCLSQMRSLKELYLLGNPCMNLKRGGFDPEEGRLYVIAKLPHLEFLDGDAITRSQRLRARQRLVELEKQLKILTMEYCQCSDVKKYQQHHMNGGETAELTSHCPEDRVTMSNECAKQKAEKDKNEKAHQPKFKSEKDVEQDQLQAVDKVRRVEKEKGDDIKQCNEGRWEFWFDEEKQPGYLTLGVGVQKHLSSSLIDVDVHPTFVSVVIKSKVLRVKLPTEVKAGECTAQRITTTGYLIITMPKLHESSKQPILLTAASHQGSKGESAKKSGRQCLQQELVSDAKERLNGSVKLQGLVKNNTNDSAASESNIQNTLHLDIVEKSTTRKSTNGNDVCDQGSQSDEDDFDDDGPPPLV
mmetsp:Transcript_2345/g.4366  ORF Transcript_2345/g.4366 Transcript_2345/m.4366 type:complete len:477 (-) Transcript_2345:50-1480(-)